MYRKMLPEDAFDRVMDIGTNGPKMRRGKDVFLFADEWDAYEFFELVNNEKFIVELEERPRNSLYTYRVQVVPRATYMPQAEYTADASCRDPFAFVYMPQGANTACSHVEDDCSSKKALRDVSELSLAQLNDEVRKQLAFHPFFAHGENAKIVSVGTQSLFGVTTTVCFWAGDQAPDDHLVVTIPGFKQYHVNMRWAFSSDTVFD